MENNKKMEITQKIENSSRYFARITQHRRKEREKRIDRKNITIYDMDVVDIITEWAKVNNTSFSAIVANLCDELLTKIDSPQKTIETFELEYTLPALDATPNEWRKYLKTMKTCDEYKKKVDKFLQSVLTICNQRNAELER